MKKVSFIILFLSVLLKKWLRILAANKVKVALLGFLLALFLVIFGKTVLTAPTVWSVGVVGVYDQSSLPSVVTNLISKSLVTVDKGGVIYPALAESWSVNNDATEYTFKLKEDLFWQDGSKLKSSDLTFRLPEVEVSYPDDRSILFKLAQSFSPFPTLLTPPLFKKDTLIGVGKFRVKRIETNRGLVTKLVLESAEKIVVRFYPEEKVARVAFLLGEIDYLVGVSQMDELLNQPSIGVKKMTSHTKVVAVFYNTKDPLLSDKNLRRALSFAAPKVEGEERARGPISPQSWAYNDQVKDYLGKEDEAKEYLTKIKSDQELQITLTTTAQFSSLGEKIIQAWKQLGVPAVLRIESGDPQNFQALLSAHPLPHDPDQYGLWHSSQTQTNLSKYKSDRVDRDLEDGRRTNDQNKRKELYFDFQKMLLDDAPATFLYYPKTNVVYRKKTKNSVDEVIKLLFP